MRKMRVYLEAVSGLVQYGLDLGDTILSPDMDGIIDKNRFYDDKYDSKRDLIREYYSADFWARIMKKFGIDKKDYDVSIWKIDVKKEEVKFDYFWVNLGTDINGAVGTGYNLIKALELEGVDMDEARVLVNDVAGPLGSIKTKEQLKVAFS